MTRIPGRYLLEEEAGLIQYYGEAAALCRSKDSHEAMLVSFPGLHAVRSVAKPAEFCSVCSAAAACNDGVISYHGVGIDDDDERLHA